MKEDSGQAKTSGLARQRIPESLERQRRQMRLVHVRIKSSQGLGLICGDGHDVFQVHAEVKVYSIYENRRFKLVKNKQVKDRVGNMFLASLGKKKPIQTFHHIMVQGIRRVRADPRCMVTANRRSFFKTRSDRLVIIK